MSLVVVILFVEELDGGGHKEALDVVGGQFHPGDVILLRDVTQTGRCRFQDVFAHDGRPLAAVDQLKGNVLENKSGCVQKCNKAN